MTDKILKNIKDEFIKFRIEGKTKVEVFEIAEKLNMTVSQYMRNTTHQLVNRKDEIEALKKIYDLQEEKMNLFIVDEEELADMGNLVQDQIIYHCDYCKDRTDLIVKFTRKSNKYQSKFDIIKFGKTMLKCGELLYFAIGSSSFYDVAFIRCIEFTNENQYEVIEVIALTRSEYNTITRSTMIVDKVLQKLSDYNIQLKGLDVMMLRINVVIAQGEQIRRMNSKYSLKTDLFLEYLTNGENKAKEFYEFYKTKSADNKKVYKNFKDRAFELYKREYRALYELNNLNKEKFQFALNYLIDEHNSEEK